MRDGDPESVPVAGDEVANREDELSAADVWDGRGDGVGDAGVAAGLEDPEGVSTLGTAAFDMVLGDTGVSIADPAADPGVTGAPGDETAKEEEEEEPVAAFGEPEPGAGKAEGLLLGVAGVADEEAEPGLRVEELMTGEATGDSIALAVPSEDSDAPGDAVASAVAAAAGDDTNASGDAAVPMLEVGEDEVVTGDWVETDIAPGVAESPEGGVVVVPAAKPGVPVPEPGVPAAEPGVPAAEPGVPVPELGVPAAEPGVPAAEPGVPAAEPGVPAAEPGVPAAEPGVPAAKLGVPAAEPGVPAAEPGVPAAELGVPAAEPGVATAEPGGPAAKDVAPLLEGIVPLLEGVVPLLAGALGGVPLAVEDVPPLLLGPVPVDRRSISGRSVSRCQH